MASALDSEHASVAHISDTFRKEKMTSSTSWSPPHKWRKLEVIAWCVQWTAA